MREARFSPFAIIAAIAVFGSFAGGDTAHAAGFTAPKLEHPSAVVKVHHHRYWYPGYYPYYAPYPAYGAYYYGPPVVAYPTPPVVYYPGPRYYPGPAVYGPSSDFVVERPYGSYYVGW